MTGLMDRLLTGLDDDERIVYPKMYLENLNLYDKILGIAYLVVSKSDPNGEIDWVWEHSLPRILKETDVEILSKQYVVRVRLPWNEVETQWLISQEELDAHREEYLVLDVYLRVRHKDKPLEIPLVDPLEFESNRDKYDVVEIKYLVTLKLSPEQEKRFLNIDEDSFHRALSV